MVNGKTSGQVAERRGRGSEGGRRVVFDAARDLNLFCNIAYYQFEMSENCGKARDAL